MSSCLNSSNNSKITSPSFSRIDFKSLSFIILDCPTEDRLNSYLEVLNTNNVKVVVRACFPSYPPDTFTNSGISVRDLNFEDGGTPDISIIHQWLQTVKDTFYPQQKTTTSTAEQPISIAVHCTAGLGRAPVLVAVALIEVCGMQPLEAIEFIRSKRRGCFNSRQIRYLDSYKRSGYWKVLMSSSPSSSSITAKGHGRKLFSKLFG